MKGAGFIMHIQKAAIDYGIIGLGRFGTALIKALATAGKEIIAIDTIESRVKQTRSFTESAFIVSSYDKEILEESGIQNCATVIVCIGDSIDTSVLTTLNVISMDIPKVIARAMNYEHGLILEKIGADVIYPENDMAIRLADRLVNQNIMESIELRGDVAITELHITNKLANQTVRQADLRQRYNLNIIAFEHNGVTTTDIKPDYVLQENDNIVVIGFKKDIRKLETYL